MANPLGDSVMAKVPTYIPVMPITNDFTSRKNKLTPQPARMVAGAGGTAIDAYNFANKTTVRGDVVVIQNNGTGALYFAYDQTATTAAYHGIIAGSAGAPDGLGGTVVFEVERYGINQISVISSATIAASVTIFAGVL